GCRRGDLRHAACRTVGPRSPSQRAGVAERHRGPLSQYVHAMGGAPAPKASVNLPARDGRYCCSDRHDTTGVGERGMKFWVTIFNDVFAQSCRGEDMTLDEVAELIRSTRAPKKSDLPLLKFARFGPLRTPTTAAGGGSLRHDANVTMTTGIEGDYDGETMP